MRNAILKHLRDLLHVKKSALEREIQDIRTARNSDTKSSAGDKHEVGRAMIQQELDRSEDQLEKTRKLLGELDRISLDSRFDRVAFGSLITTDQGLFFIAIGHGRSDVNGTSVTVLSLASPLGMALKGKRLGDVVEFNGKAYTVLAIE